jgi:hypothetical protein
MYGGRRGSRHSRWSNTIWDRCGGRTNVYRERDRWVGRGMGSAYGGSREGHS